MSAETKTGRGPTSRSDVIARTEKYIITIEAKSSVKRGPAARTPTGRPSRRLFCSATSSCWASAAYQPLLRWV